MSDLELRNRHRGVLGGAPGGTVAGIRAAIDAVDRLRDGWSKTLSGRDERSGTEATQAVAVGVSGIFATPASV